MTRVLGGLIVVVALLQAAGCGYATKDLYPPEVRSVAVPIFENRSFYRGAERDLTEALVKQIELRTPYKVVGRGGAETVIEGVIVEVRQDQLSRRRPGGLPQEMQVAMVVDFEWKNLRTGHVVRERRGLTAVGRYVPTRPLGEPYEVAQHQAAEAMADAIVNTMRADW